jgi:hypothetical protein
MRDLDEPNKLLELRKILATKKQVA